MRRRPGERRCSTNGGRKLPCGQSARGYVHRWGPCSRSDHLWAQRGEVVTLSLVGVLPVSGVNLGLAMMPPILQAEIAQLELDITNLGLAVAAQVQVGLSLPNLATLTATLEQLKAALASLLSTSNMVKVGASLNVELGLQLGVIELALEGALAVQATLEAGLGAPGIAAWSYSGAASGLASTAPGGITGPWQRGLLVATESVDSWGQFSVSVNTGPSKTASVGGPQTLTALGQLGGAEIDTGLVDLKAQLDLLVLKWRGLKAQLEQQIQVTLGVNLPDLSELLALLEELMGDIEGLLDNLVTASVDLDVEIHGIQLRLDALLDLVLSLEAQLSAGGLALWSYSGDGTLGSDVAGVISGGVPGGTGANADIRALVLGCAQPSAWADFSPLLGGV